MNTPRTCIALALAMIFALAGEQGAMAANRDTDGSRMQARFMKVGSVERDRLAPPGDRTDWRAFRLKDAKSVSVSVRTKPANRRVSVTLTSPRGQSLGDVATSRGSASMSKKLEPGLYYVSVSAKEAVAYEISIR